MNIVTIDRTLPLRHRKARETWSAAEEMVLRELAPAGTAALRAMLPNRSVRAIHIHARVLGLSVKRHRRKGIADSRRGKIPPADRAHPLVRALIQAANARRITIPELERAAGLGSGTISDWRYRRSPRVDTLIAALNVVGLDLQIAPLGGKE